MGETPLPTLRDIPIDSVTPNPKNRGDRYTGNDEDDALAESIKNNGLRQPIVVVEQNHGSFLLQHGERRWRACKKNGDTKIRAVVHEQAPEREADAILTENLARKNLSTWETMTALEDTVMTYRKDAEKLGKANPSVENVAGKLGIPKRTAQRLWTTAGRLDERSRKAIGEEPMLRRNMSLTDLERLGSIHNNDRPVFLKKLAEAYAEFDKPQQARRAGATTAPMRKYRITVKDDSNDTVATCVVVGDPSRPEDRVYTPSIDVSMRINPLVDFTEPEERQKVAREAREVFEAIMTNLERGPTKPASAGRGKRKPQKSTPLAIVPTATFEELGNAPEDDEPAAGEGGAMPEDDGRGEGSFQDDGTAKTATRPRTRTRTSSSRTTGRSSKNGRATPTAASRTGRRTTKR